jgi:hypothetical protein
MLIYFPEDGDRKCVGVDFQDKTPEDVIHKSTNFPSLFFLLPLVHFVNICPSYTILYV